MLAYQTYGGLIALQEFEPAGFVAKLSLKDGRPVFTSASDLQMPLPGASLLHGRLLNLAATSNRHLDWSAVTTLTYRDTGTASTPDSHHPT